MSERTKNELMGRMTKHDRRTILRLAAAAGVDPRSAARALVLGASAIRGMAGERIRDAMRDMQLTSDVDLETLRRAKR